MQMDDCLFCKIVKGEVASSKIYEDDYVFAFLDIGPVNKGHTLVIPKKHYETYLDIPDEILEKMAVAIKKISKAVMKGVDADGFNLGMNNYSAAGQLVNHAHFHIMPRFKNDGLKLWPQGQYGDGEMDIIKEKITKHL